MAHYAILDENNIVTQVIVGKDENEPLPEGYTSWEEYYGGKKTSYNTTNNTHVEGGVPFRAHYAGIGFKFEPTMNAPEGAFIPPKPHESWVLDGKTFAWKAPKPYPQDGKRYWWHEASLTWNILELPSS